MKKLAVLGASGHGKVIADAALVTGWDAICFFDDSWPHNQSIGIWPVVGTTSNLLASLIEYQGVIIGIGDASIRTNKQQSIEAAGGVFVNIIHPSATVSQFSTVHAGTVIMAGAVVNVDARLGRGVIVNSGATVDHDCVLADGVHVAPGAHLSGDVHVGERSWIGVGACVKQGIRIGKDVMVGAGSVVVFDIPDGVTVVGNPARSIVKS